MRVIFPIIVLAILFKADKVEAADGDCFICDKSYPEFSIIMASCHPMECVNGKWELRPPGKCCNLCTGHDDYHGITYLNEYFDLLKGQKVNNDFPCTLGLTRIKSKTFSIDVKTDTCEKVVGRFGNHTCMEAVIFNDVGIQVKIPNDILKNVDFRNQVIVNGIYTPIKETITEVYCGVFVFKWGVNCFCIITRFGVFVDVCINEKGQISLMKLTIYIPKFLFKHVEGFCGEYLEGSDKAVLRNQNGDIINKPARDSSDWCVGSDQRRMTQMLKADEKKCPEDVEKKARKDCAKFLKDLPISTAQREIETDFCVDDMCALVPTARSEEVGDYLEVAKMMASDRDITRLKTRGMRDYDYEEFYKNCTWYPEGANLDDWTWAWTIKP